MFINTSKRNKINRALCRLVAQCSHSKKKNNNEQTEFVVAEEM